MSKFITKLTDEVIVSDLATETLVQYIAEEDDKTGVRIFVSGGGCSGMTYGMTFSDKPSEYDAVLKQNGLLLYIDAVALSFLRGVQIDYNDKTNDPHFVFKNAFSNTAQGGSCGGCSAAGGSNY